MLKITFSPPKTKVLGLTFLFLSAGAGFRSISTAEDVLTKAMNSTHELSVSAPANCPAGEAPVDLVNALTAREAAVADREALLIAKLSELNDARSAARMETEQLKASHESLTAVLALAEVASENDLSKLTSVYEAMKPADAAKLFEQMEPGFASGFLGRMQPAAAAGVLAGLPPEVAYAMSAHLAGRNANVPAN